MINRKKLKYVLLSGFILVQNPIMVQAEDCLLEEYHSEEDNSSDIVSYFEDLKEELEEKNITEKLKESIAKKFITVTDFLLYDGEIYGTTKDELTEDITDKITSLYESIVTTLNEKFPEIKNYNPDMEKLSDYVSDAKDYLSDVKDSVQEHVKDYAYDTWGEKRTDEFVQKVEKTWERQVENDKELLENAYDATTETMNKGKQKVKSWYQDLKSRYGE